VVDDQRRPLGMVTPATLARALRDPSRAAYVLAEPCAGHVEAASTFQGRERICDHRAALLRQEMDDFLVTDDDGRYFGVATRGQILNPPRASLVLVDHNELSQAVAGAEEAQIVGVLDHHRLGNPPTASPIPFVVDPVGSTSTLVAEKCRDRHLPLPAGIAGLLVSGVLSDTLVFRSPTTTDRDRDVAAWLAWVARVDIDAFGGELLRAGPGLAGRLPDEILEADRKTYTVGAKQLSIAQVEVTGLQELQEVRGPLLEALEAQQMREGLALACLMVTDVIRGRSRLLCQGEAPLLGELPFRREAPGQYDLGEVVSRKKQLVPAVLQAVEQVA
jgi:manganese-dependent inorganic pyrophosphatase